MWEKFVSMICGTQSNGLGLRLDHFYACPDLRHLGHFSACPDLCRSVEARAMASICAEAMFLPVQILVVDSSGGVVGPVSACRRLKAGS